MIQVRGLHDWFKPETKTVVEKLYIGLKIFDLVKIEDWFKYI